MTDFQSMPHQRMIDWLDEASSFYVREAADRLAAAAVKMDEIAEQVKVRPGRVEWRGEAEKAFMEWAESLASSTRSLSDYSENAAARMRDVAVAISAAQSAIPRYTSHAQAKENLEAAKKYRNDPDSATVASNARASMAEDGADAKAVAAKEEANRQAAAREMERLSSSYKESGHLMKAFPAPTFPPPPGDFVLVDPQGQNRNTSQARSYSDGRTDSGVTDSTTTTTTRSQDTRPTPDIGVIPPSGDKTGPTNVVRPEVPVDLGIDNVGTLPPPTTTTPPTTPVSPPPLGRPETGLTPPFVTPPTMGTPPVTGGRGTTPPNGSRGPLGPLGRTGLATPGPLGGGTMPRDGITGGRQVPPNSGRAATGIPRSTVIGNEHGTGTGRTPMGGPGMGGGHMGPGGQNGISGGRRLAVETGGVVGGRPQQAGAASARPFTPGGTGLVRGGAPGSAGAAGAGPLGRGGAVPAGTQGAGNRREDSNGERPDYLVEDEETWQQGGRRVAPPVID
ncbi:hypothetical protein ACF05T_19335 [Streptomyces lateritius]|uniref:Translation initiation factor IF-2 n=1 Tax=Streptomyces lateritius TaxID=67313 RepID=A0ABW6YEG3_9ACTN